MKVRVFSLDPMTNECFTKIVKRLRSDGSEGSLATGDASPSDLADIVEHVFMVAGRACIGSPGLRPWDQERPGGAATLYIIQSRAEIDKSIEQLRALMKEDSSIDDWEIITRAIMLAEQPVRTCLLEDIDLMRIRVKMREFSVRVGDLAEQGDKDSLNLCYRQIVELFKPITAVRQVTFDNASATWNERTRQTWADTSKVFDEFNQLLGKANEVIRRLCDTL